MRHPRKGCKEPGGASLSFPPAPASSSSSFFGDRVCGESSVKLDGRKRGRGVGSRPFPFINSILADIPKDLTALEAPNFRNSEADPRSVASLILGGGAGTRLFPLTRMRAKPAVPIGGCYRLIDVPMSNCINSGINKIYILTQFNSQSLNRHLARTYNLGNGVNFGDGFVEVLAATQTSGEDGKRWFQDAKLRHIENILILSGDHLYRMDYMEFLQRHINTGADISVSCVPMDESRASDFGLMKIDGRGRVSHFLEKPKGESLKTMVRRVEMRNDSLHRVDGNLSYPHSNDFGSEIIPMAANDYNVQAYLFNGYWEDIGTIKSFFDANLALADQPAKFHFYDPSKPIFTSPRFLPPTKVEKCRVLNSIVSHGCFLNECTVEHSIIGVRSRLESGAELVDTMVMGADYYQTEAEIASILAEGKVPIGIGRNTKIRNCIIDKNAKIGRDVVIANSEKVEEAERPSEGFYIRSGITVVMKNATIPDGTVI
ncbi:unnamed protein product [Spirodela intermedia]|uniref:glucose-1-phosphate adenylyltransferase n=1 Tax=Spirodela intermedia TaxID=51605 RepID=A0A7I8J0D5_SPIIN|nr:unnamed protein product [Spirodela intermedia]CAA6663685.1 unnamed protein product [Spirodela intermedia]